MRKFLLTCARDDGEGDGVRGSKTRGYVGKSMVYYVSQERSRRTRQHYSNERSKGMS